MLEFAIFLYFRLGRKFGYESNICSKAPPRDAHINLVPQRPEHRDYSSRNFRYHFGRWQPISFFYSSLSRTDSTEIKFGEKFVSRFDWSFTDCFWNLDFRLDVHLSSAWSYEKVNNEDFLPYLFVQISYVNAFIHHLIKIFWVFFLVIAQLFDYNYHIFNNF